MKLALTLNNARTNVTVDITAQDAQDNARMLTLVSQALGRPVARVTVTGAAVKLLNGKTVKDASLVGVYAHTPAEPKAPKAEAKAEPKAQAQAQEQAPTRKPASELDKAERDLITRTAHVKGITKAQARKLLGI